MNIGLIDSGIGGLSVLNALMNSPLKAHYIYVADTKHLPYGTKSDAYINARMTALSQYLINEHQVDALVIACNTATAISAQKLREKDSWIPIIGIEPAIKPAASLTQTGHIAIAATHSMIQSPRLNKLITSFATDVHVHKIEAGPWVTLVEEGHFDDDKANSCIKELITPLAQYPIDQFILGCTHFPFLRTAIQRNLGENIQLIDPALAVAKYTKLRLNEKNIPELVETQLTYLTTGAITPFKEQLRILKHATNNIYPLLI